MPSSHELEVLQDIHTVAEVLDIPLMLVGAGARVFQMELRYGIPNGRMTRDLDLAVRVETWSDFLALCNAALESARFRGTAVRHRLEHASGMPIDLVPFGGVEENGTITWPGEHRTMITRGFQDAWNVAESMQVADNLCIKVITVPSMVVLKIFAYQDRNSETAKDLEDVLFILKHYLQIASNEERIFDELSSMLASGDLSYDVAGPYLLGRDIAAIVMPDIRAALQDALEPLVNPFSPQLDQILRGTRGLADEEQRRRAHAMDFKALADGIRHHGGGV